MYRAFCDDTNSELPCRLFNVPVNWTRCSIQRTVFSSERTRCPPHWTGSSVWTRCSIWTACSKWTRRPIDVQARPVPQMLGSYRARRPIQRAFRTISSIKRFLLIDSRGWVRGVDDIVAFIFDIGTEGGFVIIARVTSFVSPIDWARVVLCCVWIVQIVLVHRALRSQPCNWNVRKIFSLWYL